MTNKYIIQATTGLDLGLDATVMAHTDKEALELGLKEINGDHNLYLRLEEVEIINVERGFDGEHTITLKSSKDGDWEELWIDDDLVESNHSLDAWIVLEALQTACPGMFIYRQEELPEENE